jgi:hypothetical protein
MTKSGVWVWLHAAVAHPLLSCVAIFSQVLFGLFCFAGIFFDGRRCLASANLLAVRWGQSN